MDKQYLKNRQKDRAQTTAKTELEVVIQLVIHNKRTTSSTART